MRIPAKGEDKAELFKKMESYKANDMDWRSGHTWGYVYDPGPEVERIGKEAYMMFLNESGVDPTVYPSLMKFEVEVVAMAAAHVGGDQNIVGNFTSGGTESIILAMKAARDYARIHKPHITEPEVILPVTAHAAFQKGGQYLGIKPVLVPVDPETFKADPEHIRKAITPNTIILMGSAPSYAHGVIDPIEDIAKIALEHDLLFHVDACMGGFLLPYFKRLGEDVPPFDFSVPGVTSLSMDLHKYAYTPKNASLILYKNKDYRRHQIFACANWTGYTMVNNAIQSSKTGGPLAAAWAVLNYIGDEGYLELARKKLEATKAILAAIDEMPDLNVMGRPQMCLVCFSSETVNVFHIIDEMKMRGWYIQPQLEYAGSTKNIHLSVNVGNIDYVEAMLKDLKECVEVAKTMETGDLAQNIKAAFADVDPATFDENAFTAMLGMAGMDSVDLPERMAEINEVMNALPAGLREKLLVEFLNDLFVYKDE